jgi:hypothetical protein
MYIEYAKKSNTIFCVYFPTSIEHETVPHLFFSAISTGTNFLFAMNIEKKSEKSETRINSPLFRVIIKTLSNDVIILIYDIFSDRKIISIFSV